MCWWHSVSYQRRITVMSKGAYTCKVFGGVFCTVYTQLLQFSPTLCDPMGCSLPGSSLHGIFQARILEPVAISSSRESSQTRDPTHFSSVSCIGKQILYLWATWEAQFNIDTWQCRLRVAWSHMFSVCWRSWQEKILPQPLEVRRQLPKRSSFLTGYWRMRRNIEVEELWDGPPEVTRGGPECAQWCWKPLRAP